MPELEMYQDDSGGWRWRIKAANGRVIASASEAYTRREDAAENVQLVADFFAGYADQDDTNPAPDAYDTGAQA